MEEWLEKNLKEDIKRYFKQALDVIDVFKDYFGEEYVDTDFDEEVVKTDLYEAIKDNCLVHYNAYYEFETPDRTSFKVKLPTIGTIKTLQTGDECREYIRTHTLLNIINKDNYSEFITLLPFSAHTNIINIKVHFPKVTITNENNKSTDIKHLYANISINNEGKLHDYFSLLRTHYTLEHFLSDYAHSHLPGISRHFQSPCLGTGPIGDTQAKLTCDNNLDLWGLFCYELSKYVTVESLAGGPYRRLESIGQRGSTEILLSTKFNLSSLFSHHTSSLLTEFFKYFIQNSYIKISFHNNNYVLGEPYYQFLIRFTKYFIKWFDLYEKPKNNMTYWDLLHYNVLSHYVVSNNKVFLKNDNYTSNIAKLEEWQGTSLFTFKGKEIRLEIDSNMDKESNNECTLINSLIANIFITKILEIFNYKYGNNKENSSECTAGSTSEKDTPGKGCMYL